MWPVAKLRWTLAEIFSPSPAKKEQTTIIEEWMCSNWNGASVKHAPARDYEAIARLSAAAAAAAAAACAIVLGEIAGGGGELTQMCRQRQTNSRSRRLSDD